MLLSLIKATFALIIFVMTLAILTLSAQADDPLAGTWVLNLAKSKFNNVPPPKSETRTYEMTGQQVNMTAERINAKGQRVAYGYTAKPNGKDYPYLGNTMHEAISITPVDSQASNFTLKGKLGGAGTRVISKDWKTMTISFKGINPKGQSVEG